MNWFDNQRSLLKQAPSRLAAMLTQPLWFCALAAVGVFLSIFFRLFDTSTDFLNLVNAPVLLLTAHPDDEVMFFAPTIQTLLAHNVDLHILCLSTGE